MSKLEVALQKSNEESLACITKLKTSGDVANLLEIPEGQLLYILYKKPISLRYKSFEIKKKTGGYRSIKSPTGGTRILLQKIKTPIQQLYKQKMCVHGFVKNKSIVSNAKEHKKKRYVLNIDLKDFFGTINFGRVRGLFMANPFDMGPQAASVMAQLCTYEGVLPQGSPVSPIISNYIAADLDRKLITLAKKYKVNYTRYADDITISSTHREFPRSLATFQGNNPITGDVALSEILIETIKASGFEINFNKVRLQIPSVRQEATGLTVNEFPNVPRKYIRNIRAMINAWSTYGIVSAEKKLIERYAKRPPQIDSKNLDGSYFKSVLYGRLAFIKMVRGESDDIYMKLCLSAAALDPSPPKFIQRMKKMHQEYDVFICHASEDKDSVVRPIYNELVKLNIPTFLDEAEIEWGDSLTAKINHALGRTKFVLAVLSKHSINKIWPIKEINSALAREIQGKQKILPLMVGNPDLTGLALLEDKLYIHWEGDAGAIAEKIEKLLIK